MAHDEPTTAWIVTVDERRTDSLDAVAAALEACGLCVDRVLPAAGMIHGRADRARREALAAVDGVASVDPVRDVSIAPPEADVQ
ncbi:hypothetical protein GCM10027060_16600 [Nesterenkonia halophila]|uniref:hypothetical protein n=1 Tax=Nesterenkonia halophila TaxID=302044 RepID=UPI001291434F|nr:hypothetical protein [Nesterenkonia halophila]